MLPTHCQLCFCLLQRDSNAVVDVDTYFLCEGFWDRLYEEHVPDRDCCSCCKVRLSFLKVTCSHFVSSTIEENKVIHDFYTKTENVIRIFLLLIEGQAQSDIESE